MFQKTANPATVSLWYQMKKWTRKGSGCVCVCIAGRVKSGAVGKFFCRLRNRSCEFISLQPGDFSFHKFYSLLRNLLGPLSVGYFEVDIMRVVTKRVWIYEFFVLVQIHSSLRGTIVHTFQYIIYEESAFGGREMCLCVVYLTGIANRLLTFFPGTI